MSIRWCQKYGNEAFGANFGTNSLWGIPLIFGVGRFPRNVTLTHIVTLLADPLGSDGHLPEIFFRRF